MDVEESLYFATEFSDFLGIRIFKSKITSAEVIQKLPRDKYPITFCVLNEKRMVVGRMKEQVRQASDGATLYRDLYGDCPHCRDERSRLARESKAGKLGGIYSGPDDGPRFLEELRKSWMEWWCNDCQGTGWQIESWDHAESRLGIVTYKMLVAALSDAELVVALEEHNETKWKFEGVGYPSGDLMREAAKRLKDRRRTATKATLEMFARHAAKIAKMTPEEVREMCISTGIWGPDGKLTPEYGGET